MSGGKATAKDPRYKRVAKWRRNVPKGTIGAVHEMLVAYDLLKRGWHVFRAVSLAAPYKVIAVKEARMLKIEVTTGHRIGGLLQHPKRQPGPWDMLAIVVDDDDIVYQPSLEQGDNSDGT